MSAQRCLIYCRVSDPGATDDYGMDAQERECRAYAARQGWEVVGAHQEFHTGTELFERPELTKVREAMRRGELDVLLVDRLDRVSRDDDHGGFIRTECRYAGVALMSTLAAENTGDSPVGRVVQAVYDFKAEEDRATIVRNLTRGKREKAEVHGRPLGQGKPAYGLAWRYEPHPKRPSASVVVGWQEDPATIGHLRRIFADYDAGLSLRQLAAALEADGVLPPYHDRTGGTAWSTSTLRAILAERLYVGEAAAYRRTSAKVPVVREDGSPATRRRHYTRPVEEQVPLPPGTAPVVVDSALFARVQGRLAHNRESATDFRTQRNPEVGILRRGLAYCGQCGNKLVVLAGRSGARYTCQGRERTGCPTAVSITVAEADAGVWQWLTDVLSDEERVRGHLETLRQEDPTADDLATVDRQRAELERQQAKFVAVISAMADPDGAGPGAAQLDVLGKQLAANARTREDILRRQAAWQRQQSRQADVLTYCRAVAGTMVRVTDWADRRAMAQALRVRFELYPATESPRWVATSEVVPEVATSEGVSLSGTSACTDGTSWTRSASWKTCGSRSRRWAGARLEKVNAATYRCRTISPAPLSGINPSHTGRSQHCPDSTIWK
jgi:site-specific DNA recombinase